jgi:hypothetical protein
MEHEWMIVSIYPSLIMFKIIKSNVVNWVHWLQAKAQIDRWKEEQDSIHNEAVWVPSYFCAQAELWRSWMELAVKAVLPGHATYASCRHELFISSTKALTPITSSSFKHV